MAKSAPLPGTSDIFPAEVGAWRFLEKTARDVFERYNYGELRTPIFEATEVFQRGLGDETEVVQKEMYTFEDRGGRSVTLRPEGTAGVIALCSIPMCSMAWNSACSTSALCSAANARQRAAAVSSTRSVWKMSAAWLQSWMRK